MELKIYSGKKPFGRYKVVSDRAFNEDKVVMVEFPNCISTMSNKPFIWMPTYNQLKQIKEELDKIEIENKMPITKLDLNKPLDKEQTQDE